MAIPNLIKAPFLDLFNLVFPVNCEYCGKNLKKGEETLCSFCEYRLPKTNYHLTPDNPVEAIFWGRIPLHSAASFLQYQKGEMVQQLIHQLKYHGKGHIGVFLGQLFGQHLMQSQRFSGIQYILPVPLHRKKIKIRGYNQSEKIAEGLAMTMDAKKDSESLVRKVHSATQTKKSRYERWENVKSIFTLNETAVSKLENTHILLVDDVITTGATIEGCYLQLENIPNVTISVVSLACPLI